MQSWHWRRCSPTPITDANHLGLYAEQISATGDQHGNFPQAFPHVSLISAAYNLDRALVNQRRWRRRATYFSW
jgi:hypothetical protein